MNEIVNRDGEIVVAHPPMPAKITEAICAVMAAVPKLAKGEQNTHGRYNFASIDDFLEAVRPLCAEAGLVIAQDEESFEIKGDWLLMTWAFTLAHKSGDTWDHRPRRTIMVSNKMGAQAFGAAQSYALKQYMRSLFQIATGEKGQDADEHAPGNLPEKRNRKPKPPDIEEIERLQAEMDRQYADTVGPREVMSNEPHMIQLPAGPEKDAWTRWTNRFLLAVSTAETVAAVDQWVLANDDHITALQGFNQTWHKALKDKVKGHRDSIAGKEP